MKRTFSLPFILPFTLHALKAKVSFSDHFFVRRRNEKPWSEASQGRFTRQYTICDIQRL